MGLSDTRIHPNRISDLQIRHIVGSIAVLGLLAVPLSTIVMHKLGVATTPGFSDFSAYWLAVERWQHGVSVFAHEDFGLVQRLSLPGFYPYIYPPAPLLFVHLYQFVPFSVGATLWGVTTIGSLWLALVILLEEYISMTWPRRVLLVPFVFLFQPSWYAFTLGQITPLLAALVTASAVAMERTHSGRESALIGIGVSAAAFVKPTIAPSGAVLLPSRRRLAGGVITVLSLLCVGVLAFGLHDHIEYITVLSNTKTGKATNLLSIQYYHAGWFEPFDILGVWSWIPRIALLLAVAGLSWWRTNTVTADRAAFAAGAAVIPLTAPEGYALSFAFYLPAVIVLVAARPAWWPWLALAVVGSHWQAWTMYYLGEFGVPTRIAVFLQPGLYAGLLIVGAALHLLWHSRPDPLDAREPEMM